MVHAWGAVSGTPLLGLQAAVQAICAVVSVATAAALALVLPQINLLPSPQQQRRELQMAIEQATQEKNALLLELHHRVGNQLAKMAALVRIEAGRAGGVSPALERIQALVEELGEEHHRLSSLNYNPAHPAHALVVEMGDEPSLPDQTMPALGERLRTREHIGAAGDDADGQATDLGAAKRAPQMGTLS
jgi:hypothetical protein